MRWVAEQAVRGTQSTAQDEHRRLEGHGLPALRSSAVRNDLHVRADVEDGLDQCCAGLTDYQQILPHVSKQPCPEAILRNRVKELWDWPDRIQFHRLQHRVAQSATAVSPVDGLNSTLVLMGAY